MEEFPDVFSEEEFNQLPQGHPWDHAIELTPGFKPATCKVYPLNTPQQMALDEFLEENLHSGCIRPSKSPMASPFFFVKKKYGVMSHASHWMASMAMSCIYMDPDAYADTLSIVAFWLNDSIM